MSELNISELRRRYIKGGLPDENLPDEPIQFLSKWFDEAVRSDVLEPNAMALATVDEEGKPNVRMVLLKDILEASVTFFTNYNSRKGHELTKHPYTACSIWWPELERQVRFRGEVSKLSSEVSREYFQSRPRESQIGAWASLQSDVVTGRDELEKKYAVMASKFEGEKIPVPDYWGGYKIKISEIEFWQGRPGRLHDRIRYRKENQTWKKERLSP